MTNPVPTLDYHTPPPRRWTPADRRRAETPWVVLFLVGLVMVLPLLAVLPPALADGDAGPALLCCGLPAVVGVALIAVAAVGFQWVRSSSGDANLN